jgi:hypothetical protein
VLERCSAQSLGSHPALSSGEGNAVERVGEDASRARSSQLALQCSQYGFKHCFRLGHHFIAPIPLHTIAALFQAPRASGIVRRRTRMLTAVDLHDQQGFIAYEVGDECTDADLTSKFVAAKSSRAQVLPEHVFGLRGRAAHRPGTSQQDRRRHGEKHSAHRADALGTFVDARAEMRASRWESCSRVLTLPS